MTETLHIPTVRKKFVLRALNTSDSLKQAAAKLGIQERTLYLWKRDFGIVWDKGGRMWVEESLTIKNQ